MAIGAMLAVMIAEFLGLQYPLTAGIVVLLSVGPTKRSSFSVGSIRLKAAILALLIGSASFVIVGFNILAFGMFLVIFLPVAFKFQLDDGIIPASVLVTHVLLEEVLTPRIIYNSTMLFIIGLFIALVLNLYMPSMTKEIRMQQQWIEEKFRVILLLMVKKINQNESNYVEFERSLFDETHQLIQKATQKAQANKENHLLAEMSYYTKYMTMRNMQFDILRRLSKLLDDISNQPLATELLANLVETCALELEEQNTGEALIAKLDDVLDQYRKESLPKTRVEFEDRAILFQYLSEFRHFIELKRQFVNELKLDRGGHNDERNRAY